jgi:hypothetical protein
MNNTITKADAIKSLHPDAEFSILGDAITWLCEISQPTEAEIQAEATRLQAIYEGNQYARDRASAYPTLTEQADMAYWDRLNGTTTLDDAITAVKTKYPKG